MPKRTTLTYTSEDAPKNEKETLYVYYCKYSGKHAFTLDCDLKKLPKRRTDGARIIDTEAHLVKLYTTDGEVKLIRRHNGKIERQYRMNIDVLPVAYRSEPEGKYVYVIDNAVATYVNRDLKPGEVVLLPPCIHRSRDGRTEVRLDIEDRAHKPAIVKITADNVRTHVTGNISHEGAVTELLEFLAKVLSVRITQVQLHRGVSNRNRILLVDNLTPEEVYEKLQAHLARVAQDAETKGRL